MPLPIPEAPPVINSLRSIGMPQLTERLSWLDWLVILNLRLSTRFRLTLTQSLSVRLWMQCLVRMLRWSTKTVGFLMGPSWKNSTRTPVC